MYVHIDARSIKLVKPLSAPLNSESRASALGQAVTEFCQVAQEQGFTLRGKSEFTVDIAPDKIEFSATERTPHQATLKEYAEHYRQIGKLVNSKYHH